jgi:nucleoid DNA-binding protein
MKFSEIKHKIKNLGNFKSLKEIKKAGLRIVRNTKTGDYWLIEEEFLKPVVKSPRECKTILIKPEDLKYKVLMVQKSKKELKGKKVLDYIEWGEKQGFHKRPTCKSRKWWWSLPLIKPADYFWIMIIRDRFAVFYNKFHVYDDHTLGDILIKKENNNIDKNLCIVLNSTIFRLFLESLIRNYGGGGGPIAPQVYEIEEFYIPDPFQINDNQDSIKFNNFVNRKIKSIFTELGFDPDKPIREQEPKPLPDRKALDDIVFDALGLTEEERKEVYWAVAELVQNRLKKARSV